MVICAQCTTVPFLFYNMREKGKLDQRKNFTKMKLYTIIGLSINCVHWCVNKTGHGQEATIITVWKTPVCKWGACKGGF